MKPLVSVMSGAAATLMAAIAIAGNLQAVRAAGTKQSSLAQYVPNNCTLLPVVGGTGTQVRKKVSPPDARVPTPGRAPSIGVRSNWHTDWFISGATYTEFRAIILPENTGEYAVQLYLKYPDDTNDKFYDNQKDKLTANQVKIVKATPRSDLAPYQVNTNIGGIKAIGNTYTVGVAGCR